MCSPGPEDVEVTEVAGADRTPSLCTTFRPRAQDSLLPWDASRPHLPVATARSPSCCFVNRPMGLHFKHQLEGLCPMLAYAPLHKWENPFC